MAKQKKNPVTTNANGRELAPRANRGELQVTLGRGNVLIRNPHTSEPFFERDLSGFHQGTGPMVANPGKYKKGKKKRNPHGDDHNSRRPRPYQGVVDDVMSSTESRFSAPGREIIPGGQNRDELQLTSGRGNLVMRNPNEPFFEDDNSGFFQTEKDGKYSVLANPAPVKSTKSLPNGISIRLRQGKGLKSRTKVWWVDYRLKKWRRGMSAFVWGPGTKAQAKAILNGLSRQVKSMSQKKAESALSSFAFSGRKNPSNEFIFERDLSGFYQGTGPRVANPKHSDDGFPYARDLSGRFPDKDLGESSAGAVQAGGQFDERFVIAEGGTLQNLVANPHNVNLRYTECPECDLGMKLESGVNNFTCPGCNTSVSVA